MPGVSQTRKRIKRRLAEILDQESLDDPAARFLGRFIVLLIVVNLLAVSLESVPKLDAHYHVAFLVIEWISLVVLSIEYLLRIWTADQHPAHEHLRARTARWRYISSRTGLVDLVAVLPFWFAFVVPTDLRVLLVLRIARFLKLGRYSPGVRSLLDALYGERRALAGCFVILIGATLISATAMHLVERDAQPDKFGTIPDAMWWALATLATIGYGDVVPITPLGRCVAAATIFAGLIMVALPVGIVATAFAEQIHRRDFVVTWGMVARVPLFAGLNAGQIADIMRLMRAQTVDASAVIVRRGEPAHSMYFIAAGEVEIALPKKRVRLGVGHFFGEIAVLRRARRSATVTATTRTSLLVLDGHDLHALMDREPRVAERINAEVRGRVGRRLASGGGDILTVELEEGTTEPVRER